MTAPCTTSSTKRIKVQSDLNQQPQWLLIPKTARSIRDLVKSLIVRLELPDTVYDLCLDDAPILPNEDVALVRDGEHLHLRQRQLSSPQPPRLDQLHEHQQLSMSSGPDDIRRESHRKRKRVLTPEGKRRRNARNRKREKRRRLERRDSPNKRDPSISESHRDDPDIAGDTVAPDTGNDPALPDSSLWNGPRESPDKRDPSISHSQHDDPSAGGDTAEPHTGHDPVLPDSSSRNELQNVSAKATAPSHVTTPSLDCEKVVVHQPPDGQNGDVAIPSTEKTSPPKPAISNQLSNLKSNGQMTTSESHAEADVLIITANKNAALHDKDVLARNDKQNVDLILSAEAVQPEVNNSECTGDGEVTVDISFVNEVVNDDGLTAIPAVDIENKCVQHRHSLPDSGQKQKQPPNEIECASVGQKNRQDPLKNVNMKPRWKRQRLQEIDSIREQPDPPSTSAADTENKEPHQTATSVTNYASDRLETQEHPGHGADARMSQVEGAETTRSPVDVINLIEVEEDLPQASDGFQGPRQSISANSSKSNSPQSVVVSPAEPRKAILAKGGFSTLHALQVARKAGLLAAKNQKDAIQNKPEATTEGGGKVRKKRKRRRSSKSSMRYLTEEQVNESTFVGLRPETMLPPLELLDLPEGADELRQAVDVPETLLQTGKRSSPETVSQERKKAEVTSDLHNKTEGSPLFATVAASTNLLSDNRSESAKQEKAQPAEEPKFRSGLKNNQSETQASEQQRHGIRREIVSQNPPDSQRTTVNSTSPPFRTSDNFREDLVLMLQHTSKTLSEVWAKWEDSQ